MSQQEQSGYRYWAFISYSHRNEKWGRWLLKAIETYGVPAELVGRHIIPTGCPAPKRFHRSFRDRDELGSAADLDAEIEKNLRDSHYLIVICSPAAARSAFVNKEIAYFKGLGRGNRILAMIVDGEPNTGDECFPPALRGSQPIAADVRPGKDGKIDAKLKLLAGMLGVEFDALRKRDARRRRRRAQVVIGLCILAVAGLSWLTAYAFHQRNKAVKAREQAESVLQFLVYDVRDDLKKIGRLDISEKIRRRVDEYYMDLGTEVSQPGTLYNRAAALVNESSLLLSKGDAEGAIQSAQQSLDIVDKLAADDPANVEWQAGRAVSLRQLGSAEFRAGLLVSAETRCRESLAILQRLMKGGNVRKEWQRGAASANCTIGDVELKLVNADGALAAYQAARDILQVLASGDLGDVQARRDLSLILWKVGDAQVRKRDVDGAVASYRQSLKIAEELSAAEPSNASLERDLGASCAKLGQAQYVRGELLEANANFERALNIARRLVALDPENAVWQQDFFLAYMNFALLADRVGAKESAPWYRRAYEQLNEMKQRGMTSPSDEQLLDMLHQKAGN